MPWQSAVPLGQRQDPFWHSLPPLHEPQVSPSQPLGPQFLPAQFGVQVVVEGGGDSGGGFFFFFFLCFLAPASSDQNGDEKAVNAAPNTLLKVARREALAENERVNLSKRLSSKSGASWS